MKRIKFLSLFIASLLLFVFFNLFFNNLRAEERTPAQVNYQVDFWYKETLDFYQQGQYAEAKNKLNKIIKTLATNPPAVIWRSSHKMEPPQETFYKMLKQTEEIIEWKKAEQKQAEQKELQRKNKELARQKEEKEKQLAEEKARQGEERKAREAEKARLETERKAKEEKLAQQKEERLKQEQELKAKQEEERKAKEAEFKAQKEKEIQEKQLKLETERKAREEELARQRQEKQKQLAEEKARQEQEHKTKEEELSRQKEGRLKQQQELKAKQEEERKARETELTKQKEEKQKQLAEEKAKQEAERKARETELTKQKEEKQKQLAEERAKQEQERKAKGEEKARAEAGRKAKETELKAQREERLKEIARAEEIKQAQLRARQEELAKQREERPKQQELKAKQEEERKAKEAEFKAQKEKEIQEKQLKLEAASKARKEELARQREEKEKQLAEEKAKREEERKPRETERKAKEEKLAQQKEEHLKQQQELKAQKEKETQEKQLKLETERKAREEELARQKEERDKQLAEEKAKQEQERKVREEELAQQRLKQQLELEAKKRRGLKAKQEELSREREKLETKVNEIKRDSVQEKAMTEAMLKKHRHDQAKIKKIEKLWIRAKRLYAQGMYEEAIKDFDEIIKLEGNPRIKYTPYAKEFIDKAKNNLIQKNKVALYKGVEQIEKEMVNQVLKQQVPPYIELPKRIEQREPAFLIEPPAIRKKLKAIKITMDFDKVGLKSVLAFLAQESGINFVASQKVLELALVVSARFKEASLDEVIKYITKNIGLLYRIDKEIVWVAHPEEIANEPLETRVYYLNRGGGLFTEFSPMSAGTTETGLGGSSAQINKIYTIEDTLKEVVSWPADAKLTYDKRINALIVRNTPGNLQMLEDMLYSMDVEPLQVLIEARFLEVDITDTKELGVDWNLASGDWRLKESGSGAFKKGIGSGSGVDFTAFTRASEGLNLTYKGMLTNSQFQAVLHALEETKKIKTLSSPRITTLNNQLASIKVVDEWIYPTRYEYEIVQSDNNGDGDYSDAGETSYKNVPKDFLRRDVGVLLKVIPAVGADKKTISLSLIPEVSEGTADGFTYTGGVTLPKFTSRNLSTTVVVNSGETVVLGGMIKESRTKTTTRVPVLGNIPLLGAIFKKNTDSISRKNLLIFVTAKVLSASGEELIVAQK